MMNGIIRNYLITVLTTDNHVVRMNNQVDLSIAIVGLTHNTSYTVNISAWTVRQGEHGSQSFTTLSCKYYAYICIACVLYYVQFNF